MASRRPVDCSIRSSARSITSRLRRPRKSILSRPSASTSSIGNCVTTSASAPFCCSGRYSVSGRSPITTAAAWIESLRTTPSSGRAMSTMLRRRLVGVVGLAQLGARLHALLERDLRPLGHQLGDPVDDAVGDAHHPAGVLDRGLRLHLAEGDDLGDVAAAVLLGDVVDHALAAGHGEVDVDVGHALAARVQEALEQQRVAHRVEVGDAQAVGDQRARRRAAAGPDADAVLAGEADEVPDDQEVVGEAHLLDRPQLELEPLRGAPASRRRSARAGPARPARAGSRRRLVPSGTSNLGRCIAPSPTSALQRSAISTVRRSISSPNRPAISSYISSGALQIELVVREAEPVGVVERVLRLDAEHRLVRDRVVARSGSGRRPCRPSAGRRPWRAPTRSG